MEAPAYTVFAVVGSLRRGSFNGLLVHCAEQVAPGDVGFDILAELGAVPHFDQDSEGDLTPASVLDLRNRISQADAVLVATPEYNSSMPGVLKNALDWASRPPGESVLKGKPAAVIGASPGRYGAARAQADVRKVLAAIGSEVLDAELAVPRAHEKFDQHGDLLDEEIKRCLTDHVLSLLELAGVSARAEMAESAAYSQECQRVAAGSS